MSDTDSNLIELEELFVEQGRLVAQLAASQATLRVELVRLQERLAELIVPFGEDEPPFQWRQPDMASREPLANLPVRAYTSAKMSARPG
jgi:hypothetical protein